MKDIIMVGCGSIASVHINIVKRLGYNIIGYIDIEDKGRIDGIGLLSLEDEFDYRKHIKITNLMFFGIGSVLNNFTLKEKLMVKYNKLGFIFPEIVSPSAILQDNIKVGSGTIIRDNVVVQSNVILGKGCVVNENSLIAHNSIIMDFCQICAGGVIGHSNHFEKYCFLGFRVTTVNNIKISKNTVVGACSLVMKDIKESGHYYGIPCRKYEKSDK